MLESSKHTTVVPGTRATRCAGSGAAGEHSTDSLYKAPGPRRPTASCSACGTRQAGTCASSAQCGSIVYKLVSGHAALGVMFGCFQVHGEAYSTKSSCSAVQRPHVVSCHVTISQKCALCKPSIGPAGTMSISTPSPRPAVWCQAGSAATRAAA